MPSKFARRVYKRPLQLSALLLGTLAGFALAEQPAPLTIEFGNPSQVAFGNKSLPIRNLSTVTGNSNRDNCVLAIGDTPTFKQPIDDSLLAIAASSGATLGYFAEKGWIGIRQSGRGVPCGRVSEGQSIFLSVGTDEDISSLAIEKATFGVNVKGDVVIDILATAGEESADRYQVRTGRSTETAPPSGLKQVFLFAEGRADSGPDSEADYTFTIEGSYDTFKLTTANSGQWSLGSRTTTFELAIPKTPFACGETREAAFSGDQGDGLVRFTRLDNIDGVECDDILASLVFRLSRDGNEAEFVLDGDYGLQQPSFLWEVTWPEEDVSMRRPQPPAVTVGDGAFKTVTALIEPTRQQFLPTDATFFIDMCLGDPIFDEGGFVGFSEDDRSTFPDLSPTSEGTQYACWLTRSLEYRGGDKVQVSETGYLQGDWTATRALR